MGRSQVAVKTIPWPTQSQNESFSKTLLYLRTFIEGLHRTPAPRNEPPDVTEVGHKPLSNQKPRAELGGHDIERHLVEQPL
jgi:hypothetical protein